MSPVNLIVFISFGLICAFALGVGIKAVCIYSASRATLDQAEQAEKSRNQHNRGLTLLSRPTGKKRDSNLPVTDLMLKSGEPCKVSTHSQNGADPACQEMTMMPMITPDR